MFISFFSTFDEVTIDIKDIRDETYFVLQRFALGNYTSLYWTDTSWLMKAVVALMKVYERKLNSHASQYNDAYYNRLAEDVHSAQFRHATC